MEGFKGSGTTLRRVQGEAIHVVNIQGSSCGGKCCVNVGLHFSFLPKAGGGLLGAPESLKEYECNFRNRVRETHELDHWWRYGETEKEAEASVASLIELYGKYGALFFKKFEPYPEVFEKITPAEMDAGDLSKLPIQMNLVNAALTLARIMNQLKRVDLRRQFAEIGLRNLGKAVGLKAEFEYLRGEG